MIVNKKLMARARFEKKQIGELTVKEFRTLMQQCFDADRAELKIEQMKSLCAIKGCLPNYNYTPPSLKLFRPFY